MNGRRFGAILGLSLAASPAVAAWVAAADLRRPIRWVVRGVAVLAVVSAAAILLARSPSWQTLALVWLAFCFVAGLAIAVPSALASPREPAGPATPGWGAKALVLIIPLAVAVPSLAGFVRLLGASLFGDLLARLDPQALDPDFWLMGIAADFVWTVPAAVVFTALSLRRGRLHTSLADLGRAVGAWGFFLLVRGLVVSTGLGFLRTQTLGIPGFEVWSVGAGFVFHGTLIAFAVPLTLYLAWGRGPVAGRTGVATALLLAAVLNLGLLFGLAGAAQFAAGRALERQGNLEASMRWYRASLRTDPSPELTAYLQHRVSLIRYKLGQVDLAREGFRRLAAKREAAPELSSQARFYAERLEVRQGESEEAVGRVVLPGVEVPTEARAAYCAPNTLGLVLRHFGTTMTVAEIGEQASLVGVGTTLESIARTVERQGFELLLHPFATLDDLRWLIDRDLPALVFTPGHVLAVFGYDDRLGTAVSYDTAKWDIWVDRPYAELLGDWGEEDFLLGVVVPGAGDGDRAAEARERFGGPRAEATRHWALVPDDEESRERMNRLRRAVLADPTFFPAIFEVLDHATWAPLGGDPVAWLERNARMDDALAEARSLLGREHASREVIARSLAEWYAATEQWDEVLDLASELSESGVVDPVREAAGIAAARRGDWERAAFFLEPLAGDRATSPSTERFLGWLGQSLSGPAGGDPLMWLMDAHLALGEEDAAAVELSRFAWDMEAAQADRVLSLAREVGPGRGPDYLASIERAYLRLRPEDVAIQLDLARLSLEAAETEGDEQALEHLQRARRAALFAGGLATAAGEREAARELLETARERLDRRVGGRGPSSDG